MSLNAASEDQSSAGVSGAPNLGILEDARPTEANGDALSSQRIENSISISIAISAPASDIDGGPLPHPVTAADTPPSLDPSAADGVRSSTTNTNIPGPPAPDVDPNSSTTPVLQSTVPRPEDPSLDSPPSTPHTPTSSTNGGSNDATSATEPPAPDRSMPIAIVGMGCRFPGDATSPDRLWELVAEGRSARSEFPEDRFNVDSFYHPSGERKGAINLRGGYFLKEDVALFDAPFFSITPNEARAMDPQQRLLLEVAYESLENAGMRMEDVVGSQTSCYVGSFTKDYSELLERDPEDDPKYHATGTGAAILSNRISWFFDFKGPSLTLDTACSSSLVCLHLACQSLRTGESKMALVGGTNIIINPNIMVHLTALNFLSPDSKCQAFDHKANGYARGDGIASIVLKPLEDALRDNDVIRGVIRSTAVNQDGKTPGITNPSIQAQEDLIRLAYDTAGLDMNETAYFEAHGTGTQAGDPVEAGALARTFGATRTLENPLLVGTVKTNLGHLEGASGLAGLIKAVYTLENGVIPPNLWLEKPNPRISFEQLKIKVPTELTPWPTPGLRRTSLNSFGYGGTNAHVIIDDAYNYLRSRGLKGKHNTIGGSSGASMSTLQDFEPAPTGHPTANYSTASDTTVEDLMTQHLAFGQTIKPPRLLVWSANEQSAIERQAKLYAQYLTKKAADLAEAEFIERLTYTLSCRRTLFPWKSYSVGTSIQELRENLDQGLPKPVRSSVAPKLAFVFTGQGAQWHAMGRELFSNEIFRTSLEEADMYLRSLDCAWSLIEELLHEKKTSNINSPAYSQPICTALQIALVDLLDHWGIKPVAVVGHSSGEIAAAYCKGAISRQSAWAISYQRGRLTAEIKTLAPHLNGAMLAVALGKEQALEYITQISDGEAVVACINSPSSVTISGDVQAVDQLEKLLSAASVWSRKLKVENAYHSPHMQVIAAAYLESLGGVQTSGLPDSDVAMFSSVTGDLIKSEDLGPSYWVDNMTSPVEFSKALSKLEDYAFGAKRRRRDDKSFVELLLELGPAGALKGPVNQITAANETRKSKVAYLSFLSRDTDAYKTALEAVGQLFIKGYPIDLWKVNSPLAEPRSVPVLLTDLPSYSWNRTSRYWFESHLSTNYRFRKHPRLDLLGAPTPDYNHVEPKWRNFIRKSENPWILDHKVQSSIIYPAAGSIIMAVEAMRQIANEGRIVKGYELRDVKFGKAMMIPQDEEGIETTIQMRPWKIGSRASTFSCREFSIFSMRPGQDWEENCSGLIMIHYEALASTSNEVSEETARNEQYHKQYLNMKDACVDAEIPRQLYESLETIGLQYGPTFRNLINLKSGDHKSIGGIRIPDTKSVMPQKFEYPHVIHPATLDTVFQLALPALTGRKQPLKVPMLPLFLESLFISDSLTSVPGDELYGYASAERSGYREADSTAVFWDQRGSQPKIIVEGLRSIALSAMTTGNVSSESRSSARDLCFQMCWKEDTDLVTRRQCEVVIAKAAEVVRSVDPSAVKDLEQATFVYIQRALKAFPPEATNNFPSHLKLLYGWMQHHYECATKGTLGHQDGIFDWLNLDPVYEKELLARVAEQSVDGKMLCRLGEHLEPMFKGEEETLQVMLEGDLLYEFYRYGVGSPEMNAQVAAYMDLLAHKRPDIKIIEIGAGTCGTSLPVLQTLGGGQGTSPRFSSYTVTDVSSGFFEKAQGLLSEWAPYLHFQKLDIEKDPGLQGFELGTYDVVIAANCLHVSHSIGATLANVKSLLKPGGKLVLGEITHMLARGMFMFGWLPGWWIGEDDGRELGPSLTEPEWNKALIRQGFSGTDVCVNEFKEPNDHMLSVIVSTASPDESPTVTQDTLIITTSSSSDESVALAENLCNRLITSQSISSIIRLEDVTPATIKGKACIVLADIDSPLVSKIDETTFQTIKDLCLQSGGVLWISKGGAVESSIPEANWFVGLSRTIRAEHAGVTLSTLDLDSTSSIADETTVDAILRVFASTSSFHPGKQQDCEFALRDGVISSCRVIAQKETNEMLTEQSQTPTPTMLPFNQPGRPLKLEVGVPGVLSTLQFVDDLDALKPLAADEIEIKVVASALNFVDIMIAMGQVPDTMLGAECSGIVTRVGSDISNFKVGDRAITWGLGYHSTYARNPGVMFQSIPDEITFEEAASIPVIYCTSYYAFYDAARLRQGESVLIHSAAGGVGQSAIILAQAIGAEIFATVGSEEKKQLIMSQYGIPEDHIFDSRNLSFGRAVNRMTKGRGVDVVLNSLAGDGLRESWLCLAPYGRFVEIGKKDIVGNTGLEMAPFMHNRMFVSVNILGMYRDNVRLASRVFADVMDLVRQGVARAIKPITVYNFSQMETAFTLMQAGKNLGKIVLRPNDDDVVPVLPSSQSKLHFDQAATYLLVGGLGGLGRSVARWMVGNGAKNIIFTSRSGAKDEKSQKLIDELLAEGATVTTYACDVSDEERVKSVLEEVGKTFPPIKGVVQGAMVLQDALFANMTFEDFTAAIRPKINGSRNLHNYLPRDMDFFIMLSSSAGMIGTRGQGNYNAGNTYQDALANYRASINLPATSIDLGMILGVGYVAEKDSDTKQRSVVIDNLKNLGMIGIREEEFLAILGAAITGYGNSETRIPSQVITGLSTGGMIQQSGAFEDPFRLNDAKFTHVSMMGTHSNSADTNAAGPQLQRLLAEVTSMGGATSIITEAIIARLAKSMMIPVENLDPSRPVNAYGVDSLVAVELRNWIFREIKADMSVFDILSSIPISALSAKIATHSALVKAAVVEAD